jgi:hypothetical protein
MSSHKPMLSLVIGMGIGQLYRDVLLQAGHSVVTVDVDPHRQADYATVEAALTGEVYDSVHICTPNWTHEAIARQVAIHARIVFIEKPGLSSAEAWHALVTTFPSTRFMMVKNNQHRENINDLKDWAVKSDRVVLRWTNRNRVPGAGGWFTTRAKSWGGCSRDLMPHLLSLVCAFDSNWANKSPSICRMYQRWTLDDLLSTEYGIVDSNGTYDVDDRAALLYSGDTTYDLVADWRNDFEDDRGVEFFHGDVRLFRFELGLCPEDAYAKMIDVAFQNVYNKEYWDIQLSQDLWIHQQMTLLSSMQVTSQARK